MDIALVIVFMIFHGVYYTYKVIKAIGEMNWCALPAHINYNI
jgi:hypothetical protein